MVSNKTLALFIIVTVIISLGGTLLSLNMLQDLSQSRQFIPSKQVTGLASGTVELNISTNMSCVIASNVSFGASTGQILTTVNLSTNLANTNGFNNCASDPTCMGMMINNTGNVNVNVTFKSDVNGTTLLGGPGASPASFNYSVANGSNNGALLPGCNSGLKTAWGYVNETITTICTNLTATSTNKVMTIEYNATIDANTPTGLKTATITITCAQN